MILVVSLGESRWVLDAIFMKMVDRDEFHRGAMRQKMAIFKRGNSVWRGTKFFEWHIFQWGRCWWKSSFYWKKIEIGRTLPKFKHFSMGAMLMKIVILLKENWSHIYQILNIFELVAYGQLFQCRHVDENYHLWKEIGCTWPHFINLIWSGNDARELTIFKKRNHIWRGTNVVMRTMFMKIIILLKKKDRTW